MAETPNHEYNVPEQGTENWHVPLNRNFEAFEVDIELRDQETNLDDYTPTAGAKFLATDTGVVYIGDGADWTPAFVLPGFDEAANQAIFDQTLALDSLSGSLTGGTTLTSIAGNNLSIDSNGQLNAAGGGGGGGGNWTETNNFLEPTDASVVGIDVDEVQTASLSGGLTGGTALSDIAGNNLSIDSSGRLNASTGGGGGGGGISSLSGGDGIDPDSIGDGDTLSVAWDDGTDLDTSGAVDEISGSVTGGTTLVDIAGNNLTIDSNGRLNATTSGGGISGLSGGEGIDPASIGDGDTLSVAWDDATSLGANGQVNDFGEANALDASGNITDFSSADSLDASGAVSVGQYLSVTSGIIGFSAAAEWVGGGNNTIDTAANDSTIGGGSGNSITSASGGKTISGGVDNSVSGPNATVGGGKGNTADSQEATVPGGRGNTASGLRSTVGGGNGNSVVAGYTTVAGGQFNEVYDEHGTIGGGYSNQAGSDDGDAQNAAFTTVGGGENNQALSGYATIGGGDGNTASGLHATVGGGINNAATSLDSIVGGGTGNTADGVQATVSGGGGNDAAILNATVSGGQDNTASGDSSAVGGGQDNTASSGHSVVGGGLNNAALGNFSSIGGGGPSDSSNPDATQNVVYDDYGTVGGGGGNQAGSDDGNSTSATFATVGGGDGNQASGQHSTVGGGENNEASADRTTVTGGGSNVASGNRATVGGGVNNTASAFDTTVGGGIQNTASGGEATVAGGGANDATAPDATVGGGEYNEASGEAATIPGGRENTASGTLSLAVGRNATADNDGSFVVGDSTSNSVSSDAADQAVFQQDLVSRNSITTGSSYEFSGIDASVSTDTDLSGNSFLTFDVGSGSRTASVDTEGSLIAGGKVQSFGDSNDVAGDFTGDVTVSGDFDVGGNKNFVHPVDTDDGEKEVVYTATEAGTARTEHADVARLEDGRAEVELPEHFGWVTSDDEALIVETTPYSADSGGLAVVERSTDRLVVEDLDGEGEYEFAYTVKGTRDGHEDKQVVRQPSPTPENRSPKPADD